QPGPLRARHPRARPASPGVRRPRLRHLALLRPLGSHPRRGPRHAVCEAELPARGVLPLHESRACGRGRVRLQPGVGGAEHWGEPAAAQDGVPGSRLLSRCGVRFGRGGPGR
ncbi:hypothetical protein LTR53_019980, partial [Teratosphaeriaceae sp. CCFEE 6253]